MGLLKDGGGSELLSIGGQRGLKGLGAEVVREAERQTQHAGEVS